MRYLIQEKDSLAEIAKRFKVSEKQLLDWNPSLAEGLARGTFIDVKGARHEEPCPKECREYVVQPGDTLFFIARRFRVPLNDLIAANPMIEDPDLIFPGQVICVPVGRERPDDPGEDGHEHHKPGHKPGHMKDWRCLVMRPVHEDICEPGSALVRCGAMGHVMMAAMDMPMPNHFGRHMECFAGWVMMQNDRVRDSFDLNFARADGLWIGHKEVRGLKMTDHLIVTPEPRKRRMEPTGPELLRADMMEMDPEGY